MDKKYSELTYIELVKEYKRVVQNTDILKKDLILEMARKKELEGLQKHEILKIIIADLKDSANPDYIRKVLGPEYTDQRFNRNRNKQKELVLTDGKIEKPKDIIDLTVSSPPQSFEEFKKENILLVNPIYPEQKENIPNMSDDQIKKSYSPTFEELDFIKEKDKEIEQLKQENKELRAENEKLKNTILRLQQKPVPIQQPSNSAIDRMNQFNKDRIARMMKGKR